MPDKIILEPAIALSDTDVNVPFADAVRLALVPEAESVIPGERVSVWVTCTSPVTVVEPCQFSGRWHRRLPSVPPA